jgi:hypothetical protein
MWKMSLKERLIQSDIFQADSLLITDIFLNTIDEQKRVPMRQYGQDLFWAQCVHDLFS